MTVLPPRTAKLSAVPSGTAVATAPALLASANATSDESMSSPIAEVAAERARVARVSYLKGFMSSSRQPAVIADHT